jgi:YD repeat-containing protein
MRFGMDYSQRDAQQPIGKFNYVNFGNKWTTEWLSYIEDNSGCDGIGSFNSDFIVPGRINPMQPLAYGDCANLYRRGGGSEPFLMNGSFYPGIPPVTMNSYVGPFSHSFLTRIVAADGTVSFTRTLQDGSVETFARTVLGLQLSTPQNLYFMTAVSDPQGNTVTINYDSLMRITSIVDALGQRQ